jgi:hypothetical protein
MRLKVMINNINNPLQSKALTGVTSISRDIIAIDNYENTKMTNTTTTPKFFENSPDTTFMNLGQTMHEVVRSLVRMSEKTFNQMFESSRGAELLEKADEYGIPYIKHSINWLDLIDEIALYETLLEEADNLNIDWDTSEYDPVALKQEIDYSERQEIYCQRELRGEYFASLGV